MVGCRFPWSFPVPPKVKEHVVSDLCGLSDDDAHTVVDDEAAADPGAGMDLNAGDVSGDLGIKPGQKEQPVPVQPVGYPVKEDGVYARIQQKYLQIWAAGSRA